MTLKRTAALFILLLNIYGVFTVYGTSQTLTMSGDEYSYFEDLGYWSTKDYASIRFHPPLVHMLGTVHYYLTGEKDLNKSRLIFVCLFGIFGFGLSWFFFSGVSFQSALVFAALYNLCPNIKAMASLITVDFLPAMLTGSAAVVLWNARSKEKNLSPFTLGLVGLLWGLALLGKFSNFFYFPFLIIILWSMRRKVPFVKALACIGAGVGLAALIVYQFRVGQIAHYWDALVIHSNYNKGGHKTFFLGDIMTRGVWYYFIVLMFVKTPFIILGTYLLTLFLAIKDRARKSKEILSFALPAGAILLSLSLLRVQIGYRYFLPGVVLIALLCAIVAGSWLSRKSKVFQVGALLLVSVLWVQDWMTFRNNIYLSYFNEFTSRPGRYFVDSNGDWGQELPRHIREKYPDFVKWLSVSQILSSQSEADERRFYLGTSNLSGIWETPTAAMFRVFPGEWYAAGYEFFRISVQDIFKLMWNRVPLLPTTTEGLRSFETPLSLSELSCKTFEVSIQRLIAPATKVKWAQGPVVLVHDNSENVDVSLGGLVLAHRTREDRASVWTKIPSFSKADPTLSVKGSGTLFVNAYCR